MSAHRERLQAMLDHLEHRGPDAAGLEASGLGGVAQCTLRTTAEDEHGTPPIVLGDRMIVCDAVIDNRAELVAELALSEGICDAELILHAYVRWGSECTRRLLGDFAFVILDGNKRLMFGARDPIGVRPLYYHDDGVLFRCASEMAALFAADAITPRPDFDQVALFLMLEYSETRATLYQDVRAVPPAHQITVTERSVRVERYWAPDPWTRLKGLSDSDYAERLHAALSDATRATMRSRTDVGVILSGGTDSASVAALSAELHQQGSVSGKALVLHAALPGSPDDETTYSDAVADMWALPRVNARPLHDVASARPQAVRGHRDVIYDVRNGLWTPLLEQARLRGIRTALTGEGGDDCMQDTPGSLADALRQGRLSDAARGCGLARRPWSRLAWKTLWRRGIAPLVQQRTDTALGPACALLTSSRQQRVRQLLAERRQRATRRRFPDLASQAICTALEESVGHMFNNQMDRLATLHGVRLRQPFWDRRVIELLLAMPYRQRHTLGLDKPKPVLRRAMDGLLPRCVLERSRSGSYASYMRDILLVHHAGAVRALFRHSLLAEAGVITSRAARALASPNGEVLRQAAKNANWLMPLQTMVGMEIWLRQL